MTRQSIAILLPDLRIGGAERMYLDLAHEFARLGIDTHFALLQARGELLEEAKAHFQVFDLGVRRVRQVAGPLRRYLRSMRPTGLLAVMWPLTVIAPVVAKVAGYQGRVVSSEHTILSLQYASWHRSVRVGLRMTTWVGYRFASKRIGVSSGVIQDMARLSNMPTQSMQVIHNALRPYDPPDATALAEAEAEWGPGQRRILTVGNLKCVKNHEMLLRAFAQLQDERATLMILGAGDRLETLRQLAQQLGVSEQVRLPGYRGAPSGYYQTANVFALCSNYEGFGNVIIEALSFGLPVVSTDCPTGPSEILGGGKFGLLTPVGDDVAFARALEEGLSREWDIESLRARAHDFAPEKTARAYLKALI